MSARARQGLPVLVAAIVSLAAATPLIRWAAPAPAMTVAAGRVGLAAILLAIAGRGGLAALRGLGRRERLLVVAAGALLGVHFGVWITSLYFTSTAASLALVAMNPVFAALLGALIGDRVRRREWLGIAIAGAGCATLAGGDWQAGGHALIGDGLALAGAATAAAYLVVGRRLREAMPLFPYLAAVNGVAGVGLLAGALLSGATFTGLPWQSYTAIALSAAIPSLLGHSFLNLAVRTTPTHLVALAILGEPVGASLMTWAFFAEQPPAHAAIGGAIVLGGIAVGFLGRR
ncbi:MAG: DMT family transporter [Kofleriaceae bacterium]|nr:DMT family transporter [Kofleriaceae bacterium]MCB9570596.1 DMT family transporter [Kofleriaceae bacterium]